MDGQTQTDRHKMNAQWGFFTMKMTWVCLFLFKLAFSKWTDESQIKDR